ncbi:hypothetical protein, partial [Sphingopyxis sp. SCN 67-31]|uniref:hypothetical protein n=1 Tax=Sphingopyxis sp. SCN 67-31 TaxID=1660142 RepID=UPI00257F3FEC
ISRSISCDDVRFMMPPSQEFPALKMGTKGGIIRALTRTLSLKMHGLSQFSGCQAGSRAGSCGGALRAFLGGVSGPVPVNSIPDMISQFTVIGQRVTCSPRIFSLLCWKKFPVIF